MSNNNNNEFSTNNNSLVITTEISTIQLIVDSNIKIENPNSGY